MIFLIILSLAVLWLMAGLANLAALVFYGCSAALEWLGDRCLELRVWLYFAIRAYRETLRERHLAGWTDYAGPY